MREILINTTNMTLALGAKADKTCVWSVSVEDEQVHRIHHNSSMCNIGPEYESSFDIHKVRSTYNVRTQFTSS